MNCAVLTARGSCLMMERKKLGGPQNPKMFLFAPQTRGCMRRQLSPNKVARGSADNSSSGSSDSLSSTSAAPLESLDSSLQQMQVLAANAVSSLSEQAQDPSLFYEPLLRAFLLGMGSGVLCELLHVAMKVAQVGSSLPSLMEPDMMSRLAPMFVVDHVAAITGWIAFYGLEVFAILKILRTDKLDSSKPDYELLAAKALEANKTPAQIMLPIKLSKLKLYLHQFFHRHSSAPGSPALAGASIAPAGGLLPSSPLAFRDDPSTSPSTPTMPGPRPSGLPETSFGLPKTSPFAGGALLDRTVVDRPETDTIPDAGVVVDRSLAPPSGGVVWDSSPTMAPGAISNPLKVPDMLSAPVPKVPEGVKPKTGADVSGLMKRPKNLLPGAWSPPAAPAPSERSIKRAKELQDRRSYLKNFWYAAALSQNLKDDKPLKVEMLGRTIVLFRDADGVPHCLDNVCPHRGAPLSEGWTQEVAGHGTCVVCPYHGWAFDQAGKLADVPSAPPGAGKPTRQLVDTYPVVEQEGFVWLYFGSSAMHPDERPPIPSIPELADPKWKAVYGEIEFECGHWGVFENAIDMAHIHYLHGDSFGNKDSPVIHDMTVSRDTFSTKASFSIHNKPVNPLWEFTAVDAVPVTASAFLPSTSAVKIQLGAGIQMITWVNTVPISANRCINRFALVRNFAGWEGFDMWARNAMYRILGEDKVMVEQLTPEKIRQEVSLEADLPQIAFRKLRQEWIDMGYGVDPLATEAHDGSLDM